MRYIPRYLLLLFFCFLTTVEVCAQSTNDGTSKLQQLYKKVKHEVKEAKQNGYQPLIGISTYHSIIRDSGVHNTYVNAVIRAGGLPVLIPMTTDAAVLNQLISRLDGMILTGGDDVDPAYYNEAAIAQLGAVDPPRDEYDLTIIKLAADKRLPILGICRGAQLINVAFGGTLYQDLPTQYPSSIVHSQKEENDIGTHLISIEKGSLLNRILPDSTYCVNSFHHQAIKEVAPGFKVTAYAPDHVVEGIETSARRNIIAVQFHPECLIMGKDSTTLCLFQNLVDRAIRYHKNK